MKIRSHISLHRLVHAAAALLAMPLLLGADGKGCASGGRVPVGSEVCGPRDCDGLGATLEGKLCADGSTVGRTVCSTHDDGTCFWDFPACPATDDAGTPHAAGSACHAAGGACFLGGHRCASPAPESAEDCNLERNPGGGHCCLGEPQGVPSECQPSDCAGLAIQTDARLCSDGTAVGRTECSWTPGRDIAQVLVCGWNFPPCPGEECPASKCAGLPAPGDAKLCPDGSAVGRSSCTRIKQPDASGAYVCAWDFPACPAAAADAGR